MPEKEKNTHRENPFNTIIEKIFPDLKIQEMARKLNEYKKELDEYRWLVKQLIILRAKRFID